MTRAVRLSFTCNWIAKKFIHFNLPNISTFGLIMQGFLQYLASCTETGCSSIRSSDASPSHEMLPLPFQVATCQQNSRNADLLKRGMKFLTSSHQTVFTYLHVRNSKVWSFALLRPQHILHLRCKLLPGQLWPSLSFVEEFLKLEQFI